MPSGKRTFRQVPQLARSPVVSFIRASARLERYGHPSHRIHPCQTATGISIPMGHSPQPVHHWFIGRHTAGGLSLRSGRNAARAGLRPGCLPLSFDFLPVIVAEPFIRQGEEYMFLTVQVVVVLVNVIFDEGGYLFGCMT